MLQLSDISIAYSGETLLAGVTFHVSAGERVALVGPNGAGKSSLLRLASGDVQPAAGRVNVLPGRTVAYLPQDSYVPSSRTVHDEMMSVFADVLAIEERQRALEATMAGQHGEAYDRTLAEYAHLQAEFDRRNGYTLETEVGIVLHGLGFSPEDARRRVGEFSGGWQSRVALGKVLLRRPDLLLLDEPTNHLDLNATEWLEDYLSRFPGALVVVSHDRYFLDRTTNRTLELERGALTDYPGRYSWYIAEKQRRLELQQDAHDRQSRELERQQRFIERFRAKPTKTRAAQSREKMLSKLERVEAPPAASAKVRFRFPFAGQSGRTVLSVQHVARAYGDRVVLKDVNLEIEKGDRIAIIGPNGSGKSTLIRLLAGVEEPTSGRVEPGYNVRRSYFAQHQAELLHNERTIYEDVIEAAPQGWTITDVRSLLGRFLFSGDDVEKPIRVLSGGERSRVALVKMLLQPANTLLLDEPTNHLDIPSKDTLESAITEYPGSCVVVSHDRYFLDRVATKVLEVADGTVTLHLGNYSEYRARKQGLVPEPAGPSTGATPIEEERPRHARSREREHRKLTRAVASIEQEIGAAESELERLTAALAEPTLYQDFGRYAEVLESHERCRERLEELSRQWEESALRLEELSPDGAPGAEAAVGEEDSTADLAALHSRLAELESMLMDPDLFIDEARSGPVLEEYAELQSRLSSLTAAERA